MNMPANHIIAYVLFALALAALIRTIRLAISGEFDYAKGGPEGFEEKLVMKRTEHPGRFWVLWFLQMTGVAIIVLFGLRYKEWL